MDLISFALGLSIGVTSSIISILIFMGVSARRVLAQNQKIQQESAKLFSNSIKQGIETAMRSQRMDELMSIKGGPDESSH